MNFIKDLFHRHQWVTVESGAGVYKIKNRWVDNVADEIDSILIFQRCSCCGKERAFVDRGFDKIPYSVEWAKHTLRIE